MYYDVTEIHSLEKFIGSFKMYKQINWVRCIESHYLHTIVIN